MRGPRALLILGALTLWAGVAAPMLRAQEDRGVIPTPKDSVTASLRLSKYHALLIAVESYADPNVLRLHNPVRDAKRLADVLTRRYRFESADVVLLSNPKRADIYAAFSRLSAELGPNDNLLIFFAGHGHWDSQKEEGYWLPADAGPLNQSQWISNNDVKDFLRALKARHTLLIADACFAGSLLTRDAFAPETSLWERVYKLPSRTMMTSGSKNEKVPDDSKFLDYVIKRLEDPPSDYLRAGKLFADIQDAVMANSPVMPQYGPISNVNHEGGEFLFPVRPSAVASGNAGDPEAPAPVAAAPAQPERGASEAPAEPRTPLEVVAARNRDFVELIVKKDVAMLGNLYSSELGRPPAWKDKLLVLIREDLTAASLVSQETRFEGNEAVSALQVAIRYNDPVVAGSHNGTLYLQLRYAKLGADWSFRSYSLTQKPPL